MILLGEQKKVTMVHSLISFGLLVLVMAVGIIVYSWCCTCNDLLRIKIIIPIYLLNCCIINLLYHSSGIFRYCNFRINSLEHLRCLHPGNFRGIHIRILPICIIQPDHASYDSCNGIHGSDFSTHGRHKICC